MAEDADDLAAALLSEAGWVRRVAARLVRDGSNSADDVAQDVWVQALKQRPDASTTLRGWLTEVMRRLAHTRARAEARRRARETVADGTSETVAADRLIEKAELLHRIGQMVGELDEPYRSTVLLRYFEGASSAEIARRHGVPAGTVRWRLKEALDQLRARLSREVDRDRVLRALAPVTGGGLMVPALKLAANGVVAAVAIGGVSFGVAHHYRVAAVAAPVAASAAPRADAPGDDVLVRAQNAYIHGEYDEAIALGRQAMPQDRSKAWRIIGAASCFKQDAVTAAAARTELDANGQKFIEYVCKRNDVTLPDGTPVL